MARSTIDLSRLPPPDAVAALDFDALWAEVKAEVIEDAPEAEAALELESSVIVRVAQALTYRHLLKVNEINQAVRAVMPALAVGGDLDQIGVIVGVQRLVVDPGDPGQGVPPTYEGDEAMRRRFVMAPEGYSVAGPAGAYEFHALSASGQVKDASATSPEPGDVVVTVLSALGDGAASPELLAMVEDRVSAEDTRPLTDHVTVQSAEILEYTIAATIRTDPGPDPAVVMAAAEAAVAAFAAQAHALGRDINLSAIYHALTVPGVQRVDLSAPAANIIVSQTQAAFCIGVALAHGGPDE